MAAAATPPISPMTPASSHARARNPGVVTGANGARMPGANRMRFNHGGRYEINDRLDLCPQRSRDYGNDTP